MTTLAQQAAAEVLALINGKPQTPTQGEIESIIARAWLSPAQRTSEPQLAIDIWDKIGELRAAYERLGPIDEDHAFRAVEAEIKALIGDLNALEAQIPNPPRSFADVAMRAEIALYWTAEETIDALKASQASKEQDQVRMGRLIEAVLQLAGARR
jgi:hypothetical protein